MLQEVKIKTGFDLEIINQEIKGDLFFDAVSRCFPKIEICTIDVGGGSTQVIIGKDKQINERYLYHTGAYKLQQLFTTDHNPTSEQFQNMQNYLIEQFSVLRNSKTKPELFIYESNCIIDLYNLTDLRKNKKEYTDHRYSLNKSDLLKYLEYLKITSYEDRQPILPKVENFVWYADKTIMNALQVADYYGFDEIIHTNKSVALGMLYRCFGV